MDLISWSFIFCESCFQWHFVLGICVCFAIGIASCFSYFCTVIGGMQKQSDESFGGSQAQPLQPDDVVVPVGPYDLGFAFLDLPLINPCQVAHAVMLMTLMVSDRRRILGTSSQVHRRQALLFYQLTVFDGVSLQQFNCTQVESHSVVPSAVYDAIFARSFFSDLDATNIKLSWVEGIFKEVFADDPMPGTSVPKMPIAEFCSFEIDQPPLSVASSMACLASPALKMPVFESCVASGDDLHFHSKRRQLRDAAIGKFLVLL